MIHLTRALVRRWLDALLHIADTPQRTAAAFALGVFFGFSPFLGLHTLLGILFAFLLSLNRVAVMLGVYSNLPWVIAPYYAFVTMAGAKITGHRPPPGFKSQILALFEQSVFQANFWFRLVEILKPLLVPYAVGSMIGALALAVLAYPLALAFVTSRRRIHDIIHPLPAPGSRLAFTATAYCKGNQTASGVAAQSGVAAADPELLPVGSVIEVDSLPGKYNGIYTVLDTGPSIQGRELDVYMWNCNEALQFGRKPVHLTILRLGWSPRATTPSFFDRIFRHPEKAPLATQPLPRTIQAPTP